MVDRKDWRGKKRGLVEEREDMRLKSKVGKKEGVRKKGIDGIKE